MTPPVSRHLAPTQGVLRVERRQDPHTVWTSNRPTPRLERIVGEKWEEEVDPGFAEFSTRKSLHWGRLVHKLFVRQKHRLRLREHEVGLDDQEHLERRLGLPPEVDLAIEKAAHRRGPSEFMYRAKYKS